MDEVAQSKRRWVQRELRQMDYERERIGRYKGFLPAYHNQESFNAAYISWENAKPEWREFDWQNYCDIRDGFPIGTNAEIMKREKEKENNRYSSVSLNRPTPLI